jgi:NADPH-dependent curcumin reductase CurA
MQQVIVTRPIAGPPAAADFALIDAPTPDCPEGGILVEVAHISLDPYVGAALRGRHMGHAAAKEGDVPPGHGVGRIIASKADGFAVGEHVLAETGWRSVAAVPAGGVYRKVDPAIAPLSTAVGVLGMPGLTAWAGSTQLGQARAGDVVLVSAAAGPVGGAFGQIARIKGAAKVIGIAGGADKCALVTERYGFDACVDYKAEGWKDEVARVTGGQVSLYIENVGAETLMVALGNLALYGRIILCGLAGHYHSDGPPATVPIGPIVGKRAAMRGLVVYDYYPRHDEFVAEAAPWLADGRLKTVEDRAAGLAGAPALLEKLMAGRNMGKAVVDVNP